MDGYVNYCQSAILFCMEMVSGTRTLITDYVCGTVNTAINYNCKYFILYTPIETNF